jgi:DNA-directed RNA polymerase delta subunit
MDPVRTTTTTFDMKTALTSVLDRIEREREREILTRRFGLYERKETLEQIGELLGITRERVRQLEKGTLSKLQSQAHTYPEVNEVQSVFQEHLRAMGGAARVRHLAERIKTDAAERDFAHVAFFATLAPELAVIEDNDYFNHGIVLADLDENKVRDHISQLVELIQKHSQPAPISTFSKKAGHASTEYTESLAHLSKHLIEFKGRWGHVKWPTVNPKNIRDKIHVILSERKEPLHFSEIAEAIRTSDFKRKDVTVQAIHNELIKDKRFVLIGRGIYALEDWGYKKGTVADIIAQVLREEGQPMHRDEIISRVLEKRQVKQTTILLNLQGKPQFKRVAKATYALAE